MTASVVAAVQRFRDAMSGERALMGRVVVWVEGLVALRTVVTALESKQAADWRAGTER